MYGLVWLDSIGFGFGFDGKSLSLRIRIRKSLKKSGFGQPYNRPTKATHAKTSDCLVHRDKERKRPPAERSERRCLFLRGATLSRRTTNFMRPQSTLGRTKNARSFTINAPTRKVWKTKFSRLKKNRVLQTELHFPSSSSFISRTHFLLQERIVDCKSDRKSIYGLPITCLLGWQLCMKYLIWALPSPGPHTESFHCGMNRQ